MSVYNIDTLIAQEEPYYYMLQTEDVINCPYNGKKRNIILPAGTYEFTCLGAQGGYRSNSSYGGKGASVTGRIILKENTSFFLYVGGAGNSNSTVNEKNFCLGGFNGGGARYQYPGGGGASDIRLREDSLYARLMVAGGGGSDGAADAAGGDSGTIVEYGGGNYPTEKEYITSPSYNCSLEGCKPGWGFGGTGFYRHEGYGGAGGGGWYGGRGIYPDTIADDERGGEGGSSYVFTQDTAANYPSGCLLDSQYYLTNTSITNGVQIGDGEIIIRVIDIALPSYKIFIKVDNTWKKIEKEE